MMKQTSKVPLNKIQIGQNQNTLSKTNFGVSSTHRYKNELDNEIFQN